MPNTLGSLDGNVSDSRRSTTFTNLWDSFDVNYAISALANPNPDFYGQKHIIAKALGAWIVAPTDDQLRKIAIARIVGNIAISIEKKGMVLNSGQWVISDVIERLRRPKIMEFYRDVYYPIGGLQAIARRYACDDIFALFAKK